MLAVDARAAHRALDARAHRSPTTHPRQRRHRVDARRRCDAIARRDDARGARRDARRCAVTTRATRAPAGSALDAARAFSNLVLDSKKFASEHDAEANAMDLGPRAGVVSSCVLLYSVKSGGRDAGAVEGAMAAIPGGLNAGNVDFVVDKAKANLANMWSTKVDGRVSVELGWWLVNDADACEKKAMEMLALCDDLKTPRDKLLFKIPATYAGIEATRRLEARGVACHVSHVYCREQANAAIDAGASVVQLYYSRLNAWYKSKKSFDANADPGYELARDALARAKAAGGKTKIMVASLANVDAVKRVLGADYLLVSQRIIDELANTPASDLGETIISDAASVAVGAPARLDEAAYRAACDASPASEELEIALKRNAASDSELIDYINEHKGGGGNA